MVPGATATLTVAPGLFPEHSLQGLSGFSHVWLISYFHLNTNKKALSKVHPPRLKGRSVGLFASRSPHRPSPIGLTLARLVKVEGPTLHLAGVDLVDGTPILDVKPYIPECDALPHASPGWTAEEPFPSLQVEFSEKAGADIASAERRLGQKGLREVLSDILRHDLRNPRDRAQTKDGLELGFFLYDFEARFTVSGGRATLVRLATGETMHRNPRRSPARAAALALALAVPVQAELTLPKAEPGLYRGPAEEEAAPAGPAATAALRLGLDLYVKLAAAKPDENVILSPLSAAQALAAAYNGAGGATAEEMAHVLGLSGQSLEAVNASQAGLRSALGRAGGVTLTSANSLWADRALVLRVDFVDRLRRFFAAEAATLDFADPGAAARVNGWVSRNTAGRIPAAVGALPDDGGLLLLNALYFKGLWTDEFDPARTRMEPFRLASGRTVARRRMSRSGTFAYAEAPLWQAVALPYGRGGAARMLVFLPAPGSSLDAFARSLSPAEWERRLKLLSPRAGLVELPRVKLESRRGLEGALQASGMRLAFRRGQADFSGVLAPGSGRRPHISAVSQSVFLEVDEKGTEAAAATVVAMAAPTSAAPRERPFTMIVERPYFLAIEDAATGAVLFLGGIRDPG